MPITSEVMSGWRCESLGEPGDVLRWRDDLPVPAPGPGQALVRVHAAGCNFPDVLLCRGIYQDKPELPFIPGMEVAGTVVAVGEGSSARVGDRVLGTPPVGRGGYAEFCVVDDHSSALWPDEMPAAQAAAMFVTYQTVICALEYRGRLRAGETVLVTAAVGGIGSAALQLARALGATVIAAAGGPEKCAKALELGADHALDYSSEDLVERVRELTGGRGVDVVLDSVGGDVLDAARRCVASEGRLLLVGFAGGRIPTIPANHVLMKNYDVVGVHWGPYRKLRPDLIVAWQEQLAAWWAQGLISPLVSEVHPIRDAPAALERLAGRQTIGKTILELPSVS